jgi:hypothetical protein
VIYGCEIFGEFGKLWRKEYFNEIRWSEICGACETVWEMKILMGFRGVRILVSL